MTDKRSWRSRDVAKPEPGYFLGKLVKHGPIVPMQIIRHPDGRWQATVAGRAEAAHTDPAMAPMVFRIWHGALLVTEAEYLTAMQRAARPTAPSPTKPVSLEKDRPLF